jgi:hypothetical protein
MRTVKSVEGAWTSLMDDDGKPIGLFARTDRDGVRVQVEIHNDQVLVTVWEEERAAMLDFYEVELPEGYDSNVAHCAALLALAHVGVRNFQTIAQNTARAIEGYCAAQL